MLQFFTLQILAVPVYNNKNYSNMAPLQNVNNTEKSNLIYSEYQKNQDQNCRVPSNSNDYTYAVNTSSSRNIEQPNIGYSADSPFY